jgi:hypothetical protein
MHWRTFAPASLPGSFAGSFSPESRQKCNLLPCHCGAAGASLQSGLQVFRPCAVYKGVYRTVPSPACNNWWSRCRAITPHMQPELRLCCSCLFTSSSPQNASAFPSFLLFRSSVLVSPPGRQSYDQPRSIPVPTLPGVILSTSLPELSQPQPCHAEL